MNCAIGAQIAEVRKMFRRGGLWLTAAGITLGIPAALGFTRVDPIIATRAEQYVM